MSDNENPFDKEEVTEKDSLSEFLLKYAVPSEKHKLIYASPISVVEKKPMLNDNSIQLSVVTNDAMTTDGYAEFNPETNTFTCFVPSHVEVLNVKMDVVAAYYINEKKTLYSSFHDYPELFSLSIDDSKKPCCIWFSPSAAQIDQGAEQVDHYPFDRPRKTGSCFNPELTHSKNSFGECNFSAGIVNNHSSCQFSTASAWEDVSTAVAGDVPQISVQRMYNGSRIPSYRIMDLVNSNVLLHPTSDIESVRAFFDAAIEGLDVNVISPQKNKKSYFKAVLTS